MSTKKKKIAKSAGGGGGGRGSSNGKGSSVLTESMGGGPTFLQDGSSRASSSNSSSNTADMMRFSQNNELAGMGGGPPDIGRYPSDMNRLSSGMMDMNRGSGQDSNKLPPQGMYSNNFNDRSGPGTQYANRNSFPMRGFDDGPGGGRPGPISNGSQSYPSPINSGSEMPGKQGFGNSLGPQSQPHAGQRAPGGSSVYMRGIPSGYEPSGYGEPSGTYGGRNSSFPIRNHEDDPNGVGPMMNGGPYPGMHSGNIPGKFGPPTNSMGATLHRSNPGSFMRGNPSPAGYCPPPMPFIPPGAQPSSGGFNDSSGGATVPPPPHSGGYAPPPTPMLNQLLQYSNADEKGPPPPPPRMYDEKYSKWMAGGEDQARHKMHSNQIRNQYGAGVHQPSSQTHQYDSPTQTSNVAPPNSLPNQSQGPVPPSNPNNYSSGLGLPSSGALGFSNNNSQPNDCDRPSAGFWSPNQPQQQTISANLPSSNHGHPVGHQTHGVGSPLPPTSSNSFSNHVRSSSPASVRSKTSEAASNVGVDVPLTGKTASRKKKATTAVQPKSKSKAKKKKQNEDESRLQDISSDDAGADTDCSSSTEVYSQITPTSSPHETPPPPLQTLAPAQGQGSQPGQGSILPPTGDVKTPPFSGPLESRDDSMTSSSVNVGPYPSSRSPGMLSYNRGGQGGPLNPHNTGGPRQPYGSASPGGPMGYRNNPMYAHNTGPTGGFSQAQGSVGVPGFPHHQGMNNMMPEQQQLPYGPSSGMPHPDMNSGTPMEPDRNLGMVPPMSGGMYDPRGRPGYSSSPTLMPSHSGQLQQQQQQPPPHQQQHPYQSGMMNSNHQQLPQHPGMMSPPPHQPNALMGGANQQLMSPPPHQSSSQMMMPSNQQPGSHHHPNMNTAPGQQPPQQLPNMMMSPNQGPNAPMGSAGSHQAPPMGGVGVTNNQNMGLQGGSNSQQPNMTGSGGNVLPIQTSQFYGGNQAQYGRPPYGPGPPGTYRGGDPNSGMSGSMIADPQQQHAMQQQQQRFSGVAQPYQMGGGNSYPTGGSGAPPYMGHMRPQDQMASQYPPSNNPAVSGLIQESNLRPMSPPMYRPTIPGPHHRDPTVPNNRSQWVTNMQGMSGGSVVEGPMSTQPLSGHMGAMTGVEGGVPAGVSHGQGGMPPGSEFGSRGRRFDGHAGEGLVENRVYSSPSVTSESGDYPSSGMWTEGKLAEASGVGGGGGVVMGPGPGRGTHRPHSNFSQSSLRDGSLVDSSMQSPPPRSIASEPTDEETMGSSHGGGGGRKDDLSNNSSSFCEQQTTDRGRHGIEHQSNFSHHSSSSPHGDHVMSPPPSTGMIERDMSRDMMSPGAAPPPTPRGRKAAGESGIFKKILEMGDEPDRRPFLERLFDFMSKRGQPITAVPIICKQTVDLYHLYHLVQERGGMCEVTKSKQWREVSTKLNLGASSSAGFTLKRNYGKFLFPLECKFERGDIDPAPILASLEATSKKESKKAAAERAAAEQDGCMPGNNVSMYPGYPGGVPPHGMHMPYDGGMPPGGGRDRGPMMGGMMRPPSASSSQDTVNIQDPFSDSSSNIPPVYGPPGQQPYGAAPHHRGDDGFNSYGGMPPGGAGSGYPPPPGTNYPQPPDQFGRYPGGMPRGPYEPHGYSGYHHGPSPDAMGPPNHLRGPGGPPYSTAMHKMMAQNDGPDAGSYGNRWSPSPYGAQYPPQHYGPNGGIPPYGAEQNGSCPIPRYGTMQPRYPPWQPKMPSVGMMSPLRERITFPPGSIEATKPKLLRRKRLTYKDIGPVDMWRVMMSLRSGLICESTWALDVLSILLVDDSTAPALCLNSLPGLLEVLLEHFRHYLILAFRAEFEDLEISSEVQSRFLRSPGTDDDARISDTCAIMSLEEISRTKSDLASLDAENNYTMKTRQGLVVKFDEAAAADTSLFDRKRWDTNREFDSSVFDWQMGRGDTSSHIVNRLVTAEQMTFSTKRFYGRGYCYRGNTAVDVNDNSTIGDEKVPEDHCSSDQARLTMPVLVSQNDCSQQHVENEIKSKPNMDVVINDDIEPVIKMEHRELCGVRDDTLPPKGNSQDTAESNSGDSKLQILKLSKSYRGDIASCSIDFDNIANNLFTCTQLDALKHGCPELDEEAYRPDETAGQLTKNQAEISRRCIAVSNILRNLSFVSGNESELCRHPGVLAITGKLLLLHHRHPSRPAAAKLMAPVENESHSGVVLLNKLPDNAEVDRQMLLPPLLSESLPVAEEGSSTEWWWEMVEEMRDNAAVIFANIAGNLDLSVVPEEICLPILDGLLHWSVCPSVDPTSSVSPQRLALEALCKLCVIESNVDLLVATPPFSRIVLLLTNLVTMLGDRRTPVVREFAVGLLSCLTPADASIARALALQRSSVSFLLEFIEEAEQNAVASAGAPPQVVQHQTGGRSSNRKVIETQEAAAAAASAASVAMGTSLDMVCRAATILRHLADVPENVPLIARHEARLKQLAMSQVLDLRVTAVLAAVLGTCS